MVALSILGRAQSDERKQTGKQNQQPVFHVVVSPSNELSRVSGSSLRPEKFDLRYGGCGIQASIPGTTMMRHAGENHRPPEDRRILISPVLPLSSSES